MPAYSYADMIKAKLDELEPRIETQRIILDTLNLTRPLTKQQTETYSMYKEALQENKAWVRQLKAMRKDLDAITREIGN